MEEKNNENYFNIELAEEIAEGIFTNLSLISHSNSEFILDFIRFMPGTTKAKVKSRLILTPDHAKRLMLMLQDNLEKFESVNGKIKIDEDSGTLPFNFGGPTALA